MQFKLCFYHLLSSNCKNSKTGKQIWGGKSLISTGDTSVIFYPPCAYTHSGKSTTPSLHVCLSSLTIRYFPL